MADELHPPPGPESDDQRVRSGHAVGRIRTDDIEARPLLGQVSRVFRLVSVIVVIAAAIELVVALSVEGIGVFFLVVSNVIQSLVLAAVLWAAGDLTGLLIDIAHDMRAGRVLLARISVGKSLRPPGDPPEE